MMTEQWYFYSFELCKALLSLINSYQKGIKYCNTLNFDLFYGGSECFKQNLYPLILKLSKTGDYQIIHIWLTKMNDWSMNVWILCNQLCYQHGGVVIISADHFCQNC